LNSASLGAAPRQALRAVAAQLERLERGPGGRSWGEFVEGLERGVEEARREAARLLRANLDEVGLIGDTTSGLHHAIDAIPFEPGDNVVVSDLEYPQVALAAANAVRADGVEIRWVRNQGGRLEIDAYREAIDRRTRAVLVSSVGWVTGQRLDLAGFSTLARERDLFLVVDAVQHVGGLDLDLSQLAVDFLAAGGYKWLNAPFGVGVIYVRREAHRRGLRLRRVGLLGLEEPPGGWSSWYGDPGMTSMPPMRPVATARRFEAPGTPNSLGAPGLAASLALRNRFPPGAVDRHVLELGGELMAALARRGARLWTPLQEAERAGIVTFTFGGGPSADSRIRDGLAERAIYVSTRYCAGIGGIRAAIHFFNRREDIERLVAAIDEIRGHA
jgi:cysteine desulfurase/selenocysteine lyase